MLWLYGFVTGATLSESDVNILPNAGNTAARDVPKSSILFDIFLADFVLPISAPCFEALFVGAEVVGATALFVVGAFVVDNASFVIKPKPGIYVELLRILLI